MNQSQSSEFVTVYCTRPSCRDRENPLAKSQLVAGKNRICSNCGMNLFIDRRFVPYRLLGEGGFGRTFLAWDLQLDLSIRVLKQLSPQQSQSRPLRPENIQIIQNKFREEANALNKLRHQYIPQIYASPIEEARPNPQDEHAINNEQFFYIAQDYIDGEDLAQRISRHGKFAEKDVISVLKQMMDILDYIHRFQYVHHGVSTHMIHRDLKPNNIICDRQNRYWLIDFGAVKQAMANVPSEQSVVMGTPEYASPEQISGAQIDATADLYGLAATCVHLITGFRPSSGLRRQDMWTWRDKAQVSDNLADILDKMLRKEPGDRFQSAEEVIRALRQLDAESSPTTPPVTEPSPKPPTSPPKEQETGSGEKTKRISGQSKNTIYKVGIVIAGVVAIAAAGLWWRSTSLPQSSLLAEIPMNPTKPSPPTGKDLKSIEELISVGTHAIDDGRLSGEYATLMSEGTAAFKRQDYKVALEKFQNIRNNALKEKSASAISALKDPKVLIFLNNAKVRLKGGEIYTVAVAIPVTDKDGKRFDRGQQILFGVAQAQDKAIRDGINLEVVIANDRNILEQAVEVAKALTSGSVEGLEGRSILAVVGHYTSPVTCAALPIYNAAKLTIISSTSSMSNFRQQCVGEAQEDNKVFFRTTTSTILDAQTLVRYLIDPNRGRKPKAKVAVFFTKGELFSEDLARDFSQDLVKGGGTLIPAQSDSELIGFNLTDPNFNVDEISGQIQDADALAVFSDGKTGSPMAFENARTLIQAMVAQKLILASNPLLNAEVTAPLASIFRNNPQAAKHLLIAVDWESNCGSPSFLEDTESKWDGDVNRLTALSYEAVQVLTAQLRPGITSSEIQQALSSGRDPTVPKVKSDVFSPNANINISFDPETGDRADLRSRTLVYPGGSGDNISFKLLEPDSCPY